MEKMIHCRLEAPTEILNKYIINEEFNFHEVIPRPGIYDDPELSEDNDPNACIYWYLSRRGKLSIAEVLEQYPDSKYFKTPSAGALIQELVDSIDELKQGSDWFYHLGEKFVDAIQRYGYRSWYYWDLANWGTKYNALNTDYDWELPDFHYVEFDAAYTPPMDVIYKIFKCHPDDFLHFEWWEANKYDSDHYGLIKDECGEWTQIHSWKEIPDAAV